MIHSILQVNFPQRTNAESVSHALVVLGVIGSLVLLSNVIKEKQAKLIQAFMAG
jgi:hypothetical protein